MGCGFGFAIRKFIAAGFIFVSFWRVSGEVLHEIHAASPSVRSFIHSRNLYYRHECSSRRVRSLKFPGCEELTFKLKHDEF